MVASDLESITASVDLSGTAKLMAKNIMLDSTNNAISLKGTSTLTADKISANNATTLNFTQENGAKFDVKNITLTNSTLKASTLTLIAESSVIDKPIFTIKKNGIAKSVIDFKRGKSALSELTPLKIYGKKTLIKVIIKTGRTHQIRTHLQSVKHPILGDSSYGGENYARLMLHAHKIGILGYEFCAEKGNFWKFLAE